MELILSIVFLTIEITSLNNKIKKLKDNIVNGVKHLTIKYISILIIDKSQLRIKYVITIGVFIAKTINECYNEYG